MNQDPDLQDSNQIQKDATLTLRTLESVLLASEELDTLTSHRQSLHSLAAKYKDALVKVQKRKAINDHLNLTAKDEESVLHVLTPLTEAEQHAYDVTSKLLSLFRKTVGSDVMLAAERDRKNETRALVYLLVRLRLDQEEGAPASDAQKQLFEKVAKLSMQLVNERNLDAKDDTPSDITPTEDATKDVASTEDTGKDDVPNPDAANDDTLAQDALMEDLFDHEALYHDAQNHDAQNHDAQNLDAQNHDVQNPDVPKNHDAQNHDAQNLDAQNHDVQNPDVPKNHDAQYDNAQYDNAPKQAGESILIAAGQFISIGYKPQTADALGDTQKEILAEIRKLCMDFFHTVSEDRGKTELDDSYQASEDIRCLAESINRRFGYILAKVETKSTTQRQELIMLVNLNLNHFMEECRKDVKRVEERIHRSSSE